MRALGGIVENTVGCWLETGQIERRYCWLGTAIYCGRIGSIYFELEVQVLRSRVVDTC
jgi:hypothetical protein